jgi:hypothetical protein
MTYRPTERTFGPPWWVWVAPSLYTLLAVVVAVVVVMAEANPDASPWFRYLVNKGRTGWVSTHALAVFLLGGGAASLIRSSMRGVRVRGDGLVYRDLVSWTWPKVRRFRWPQVDGILLDRCDAIGLDLWDGSRVYLPDVADHDGLAMMLEKVAVARAIPVRGGRGLDDIPEPEQEQDEEPAV